MSQPAPHPTRPEFTALIRGEREFDGSRLISKEEWEVACSQDEYLCKILEYIQQDKGLIAHLTHEIAELYKPIRVKRGKRQKLLLRIANRRKQYHHFAKMLRKKMAWEKLKEIRKDIGLT